MLLENTLIVKIQTMQIMIKTSPSSPTLSLPMASPSLTLILTFSPDVYPLLHFSFEYPELCSGYVHLCLWKYRTWDGFLGFGGSGFRDFLNFGGFQMSKWHCLICTLKIYLFIYDCAGLYCFAWAFSDCCEWGLLFIKVHGLLISVSSLVAEHSL